MNLSTLLFIFVSVSGLVFLLYRVLLPLLYTNRQPEHNESDEFRINTTPEWHSLQDHRQEIDQDPLLDEKSRQNLVESWQELADSSKNFIGTSQQSRVFLLNASYVPLVLTVGVVAVAFAFLFAIGGINQSSLTWPDFSVQKPSVPSSRPVMTSSEHPGDGTDLESRLQNLIDRLKQNPTDIQGWVLLSRTQAAMSDYKASAESLRRALIILPGHPSLLADLADMLAMANNKQLAGEPYTFIQQALENDPQHIKALALAATAAEQAGDQELAATYWDRLNAARAQLNNQESTGQPNGSQQNKNPSPTIVDVTLDVSEQVLKNATGNAVLFVFVKAQPSAGMPLAVVKIPAQRLVAGYLNVPISAMHIIGNQTYSELPDQLHIQARLAMSGQVSGSDQDWVSLWQEVEKGKAASPLSFQPVK